MQVVAALLGHAASFWLVVRLLSTLPVTSSAWRVLYLVGAIAVVALIRALPQQLKWRVWLQVLLYTSLFAALFFGADFALDALGNSVKPRSQGPAFPGGVDLYHVLFPGTASVAFGALVASLVPPRRRKAPQPHA